MLQVVRRWCDRAHNLDVHHVTIGTNNSLISEARLQS